jgi:hypothetical protein
MQVAIPATGQVKQNQISWMTKIPAERKAAGGNSGRRGKLYTLRDSNP